MRQLIMTCTVVLILCILTVCTGLAEIPEADFSQTSLSVLNQLLEDIASERSLHYEMDDEMKEEVNKAAKTAFGRYYAYKHSITWAWHDWEYEYQRDRDLFTFKSHVDYKRSGRNTQDQVAANVYRMGTVYRVYEILVNGKVVDTDPGVVIPENHLFDETDTVINERTGWILSFFSADELDALETMVKREIAANHTPRSDSRINNALITMVENLFAKRGVRVVWHWFDYTYTCDWNCYTETILIDYTENGESFENVPVYAEIFPEAGTYEVHYLKIGEQVLLDTLDRVNSEDGLLFLHSRSYEYARQLIGEKRYEEAVALLEELGGFQDSETLKAQCQDLLNHPDYLKATDLMEAGNYEEALALFETQGDYADSRQRADTCREIVYEERYTRAVQLKDEHQYAEALEIFLTTPGYKYSDSYAENCRRNVKWIRYYEAKELKNRKEYEEAAAIFEELGDFEDSSSQLQDCRREIKWEAYNRAEELRLAGEYEKAEQAYLELGEFRDSAEKAKSVRQIITDLKRKEILFPTAEVTVFPGDKLDLIPVVAPSVADGTENLSLQFETYDRRLISVDENGIVTALSTGDASVECWADNDRSFKSEITVHVVARVVRVNMSTGKINLSYPDQNGNGTGQLSFSLEPWNAYVKTGTWHSSDEAVVTVDAEGRVTATGTGKAVVTFVSDDTGEGKKEAKCTVVVSQAATAVELNSTSGMLRVGKTEQLKATVLPKNAANKNVSWSSADESVATVTPGGKVKAVAPGQTVITATSAEGPSAQYALTVKPLPVNLTITVKGVPADQEAGRKGWGTRTLLNGTILENSTGRRGVDEGDALTLEYEIWRSDMLPEKGIVREEITVTPEILLHGQIIEKHLTVYEEDGEHSREWIITFELRP